MCWYCLLCRIRLVVGLSGYGVLMIFCDLLCRCWLRVVIGFICCVFGLLL